MEHLLVASPKKYARGVGIFYLLAGPLHMYTMIVHWRIFVDGDAVATATNVAEHELMLRAGIMIWLVGQAMFIVVPLALYHLLRRVDRLQATLMVAFMVAAVPIAYANELNRAAALLLTSGSRTGTRSPPSSCRPR